MKVTFPAILSAILGALFIFNIGSVVLAFFMSVPVSFSVYRALLMLATLIGSLYFYRIAISHSIAQRNKIIFVKLFIPILSVLLSALSTIFVLSGDREILRYDEEYLSKYALAINKTLPVMVDDGLEAFMMDSEGLSLINHYRFLNYEEKDLDSSSVGDAIKGVLIKNICQERSMKALLDEGVSIVYKIYGKSKVHIIDIIINSDICQKSP